QEGVPWPLPGGRCDAALLANVLHEVEDVGHLMAELRRVLRPGGRGFVLDWSPQAPAGVGPPPAHRLPRERAEEIVRGGGFTVSGAAADGPYHYGFRFTPGLRPYVIWMTCLRRRLALGGRKGGYNARLPPRPRR